MPIQNRTQIQNSMHLPQVVMQCLLVDISMDINCELVYGIDMKTDDNDEYISMTIINLSLRQHIMHFLTTKNKVCITAIVKQTVPTLLIYYLLWRPRSYTSECIGITTLLISK